MGDGLNPVSADSSTIVRTPYALKCVTYRALSMDGAVPTPGDCYYILSYWTGSTWTSSISGNFLSSEDHGGSFVDSFAAGTYLKFHCVSNAANLTSIHLTLTYAEDW